MTARCIAIDWGSADLCAWFCQNDHCLDSEQSEAGVTRLNGKSLATVLAEVTTDWRRENTPVVMAGMVGSNVGWKVAPYLSVPACFSSIGEQSTSVGDNTWVTPGLCVFHDDNHNMMRNEETRLIGTRALAPSSLYVMSGTHCRWVQADSQQTNDFHTVVAGELHHSPLNHSLIGAGLPPQENATNAFAVGLERGLNTPTILSQLFEVHASHMLGTLPYEQASEFLSSLLIGAEVASIHDYVIHQHAITLVVETPLTARCQQTLQMMGYDVAAVTGNTVFQAGIGSIAHAMAN